MREFFVGSGVGLLVGSGVGRCSAWYWRWRSCRVYGWSVRVGDLVGFGLGLWRRRLYSRKAGWLGFGSCVLGRMVGARDVGVGLSFDVVGCPVVSLVGL